MVTTDGSPTAKKLLAVRTKTSTKVDGSRLSVLHEKELIHSSITIVTELSIKRTEVICCL